MTQKVLRVLGHQTHILFTLGRIDHMHFLFNVCVCVYVGGKTHLQPKTS